MGYIGKTYEIYWAKLWDILGKTMGYIGRKIWDIVWDILGKNYGIY